MDFPYGGDPVYRVSLLDKNDAVPSPRVVKLAVAFQLSGPGCHLGSRPGQVLVSAGLVLVSRPRLLFFRQQALCATQGGLTQVDNCLSDSANKVN